MPSGDPPTSIENTHAKACLEPFVPLLPDLRRVILNAIAGSPPERWAFVHSANRLLKPANRSEMVQPISKYDLGAPRAGFSPERARILQQISQLPSRPPSFAMNISDHFAGATLMVPARRMKSTKFMTLLGVVENWVSGSARIFRTSSLETFVFDERTNISAASSLLLAMNSFASSSAASIAS